MSSQDHPYLRSGRYIWSGVTILLTPVYKRNCINGTREHIFAVSSILQNERDHGLPLALAFLDLENAFVSVSHKLIHWHAFAHQEKFTATLAACTPRSQHMLPKSTGLLRWHTFSINFLLVFNPILEATHWGTKWEFPEAGSRSPCHPGRISILFGMKVPPLSPWGHTSQK